MQTLKIITVNSITIIVKTIIQMDIGIFVKFNNIIDNHNNK